MSKLSESVKSQKEQLEKFVARREELLKELNGLAEASLQLQGSIAALEYVQNNFDVEDKPKDEPKDE